jgi:hypothetical protein
MADYTPLPWPGTQVPDPQQQQAPQQAPQQAQADPGILAKLMGMFGGGAQGAQGDQGSLGSRLMAGGPGALYGAPNGVFPGAQGPGSGYDLKQALQQAGAALQMPYNASGSAALMNAATKEGPQFGQIGEDIAGNKTFGWINKANRSISPATMTQPPVAAGDAANGAAYSAAGVGTAGVGGMSDLLGKIETAKANGASQEDLMKMVPPQLQPYTNSILNYQGIPATLGRNATLKTNVTLLAHAIDPSYNEMTYPAQLNYMKGLNSAVAGSTGGQRNAIGTYLEHLATQSDALVGMGNSNGPLGDDMPGGDALARAQNHIKNTSADQAAKAGALEQINQKTAGEGMKMYAGSSGGGVAERAAMADRYSANMTPKAMAASLQTDLQLVAGKAATMQQQAVNAGMSPGRVEFIMAPQKAAIARIEANVAKLQAAGAGATPGVTITTVKQLGQ